MTKECSNPELMGEFACCDKTQCWEPCGELGHSEEHVVRANFDPKFERLLNQSITKKE